MDFNDTPEEAEFRQEARSWLDANAERLEPGERREGPMGGERSDLIERAKAWQGVKADAGWACITWPSAYGGRDASSIQNVIWGQEESRFRVPPNMFTIGHGMLGPTIMTHGSEAQKERYLRPLLRSDEVWCQLFSEPAAGSDLAGLRTSAAKDGDDWVVNGQKIWTSGAHYADFGMMVTRTDPTAVKHAGITYFIVDMKSPGIEIRPIKQITGSSDFNEVFFSDARIPDSNRVGAVNDGWRGAITTLMNERATLSDQGGFGLGWRDALKLAREVDWEGRPALQESWVRQRIADFYVKSKGIEYTNFRSLTALSQGKVPGPENSVSKMVGAVMRQDLAKFALEMQGAGAVACDPDAPGLAGGFQANWLASPGLRLAGGTDEILRNIVAERVLGLPAEARADKGIAFKDIPSGSS